VYFEVKLTSVPKENMIFELKEKLGLDKVGSFQYKGREV
jgi:hypothetical protein